MNKIIVTFTLMSLFILGQPKNALAENITLAVNGMVCSFCSQGVKKHLGKHKAVNKKSIQVDMDKKVVQFSTKEENKISDKDIRKAIKKAGLAVVEIKREDDDDTKKKQTKKKASS